MGSAAPPVEPGRSATGQALKQSAGEAKAEVKDLAQQAQAQARELAHQAQNQAKELVEGKKSAVADTLAGVARALSSTAQNLENEQQLGLSGYANDVASSIENFSSSIRDKDLVALRHDAERFARAKPALFLGGCVALGFAISRFLKASEQPKVESSDDTIPNEPAFAYQQSTMPPSQERWDEPMGTTGAADEFGTTSTSFATPWSDGVKR